VNPSKSVVPKLRSDFLADENAGVLGRIDEGLPRVACRALPAKDTQARFHRSLSLFGRLHGPFPEQQMGGIAHVGHHPVAVDTAGLDDDGPGEPPAAATICHSSHHGGRTLIAGVLRG